MSNETTTVEQPVEAGLKDWYVINTYSGYEDKVKREIETRVDRMGLTDKVEQIVVPTVDEIEIRNGQRHTVQRKVFPGYVLVRMEMADDAWYVVRNTPGVTSFVGIDNKPIPLGENEVKRILSRMEEEPPKVKMAFKVGEAVRITDGPFAEFEGNIDSINDEKGKVRVLISIFGRSTPVELDFLQVEQLVP